MKDVLPTRTEAATAGRENKMLDTRSAVIASVECKDATGQRLKNSAGGHPSLEAGEIAQWLGAVWKVITEDMSSRASPIAYNASFSDLAAMRTVLKCTYTHNHKNKYFFLKKPISLLWSRNKPSSRVIAQYGQKS